MSGYMIDGKAVRKFLFVTMIGSVNGQKFPEMWQVEAFSKDHAYKRLRENAPSVRQWEFIEELDAEHEVGKLGHSLPMFPHGVLLKGTPQ